ncbi:MAG: hypothetical protein QOE70_5264 [Chthoniobacter sp.]|jgi:D-alanyl-D-alanine dipeptidase|nr:hypothetical protein [Chthoniobacter sp.]
MRFFHLLSLLAVTSCSPASDLISAIPGDCRQLIFVTTPDWGESHGSLRLFERTRADDRWKIIGRARDVLTGERGLAWGLGLHQVPATALRRKREGDRCAPAGIFRLVSAFGAGPQASTIKLPYRRVTADTEAIDDPRSRFYNQIVARSSVPKPDWKSSEKMALIPDYALGLVVAHNPRNQPGAGSCIFLHLWLGDRRGTAGCTGLRKSDLEEIMAWLDPRQQPILIQLPRAEVPEGFR